MPWQCMTTNCGMHAMTLRQGANRAMLWLSQPVNIVTRESKVLINLHSQIPSIAENNYNKIE